MIIDDDTRASPAQSWARPRTCTQCAAAALIRPIPPSKGHGRQARPVPQGVDLASAGRGLPRRGAPQRCPGRLHKRRCRPTRGLDSEVDSADNLFGDAGVTVTRLRSPCSASQVPEPDRRRWLRQAASANHAPRCLPNAPMGACQWAAPPPSRPGSCTCAATAPRSRSRRGSRSFSTCSRRRAHRGLRSDRDALQRARRRQRACWRDHRADGSAHRAAMITERPVFRSGQILLEQLTLRDSSGADEPGKTARDLSIDLEVRILARVAHNGVRVLPELVDRVALP